MAYTKSFKEQAMRLVAERGYTPTAVAVMCDVLGVSRGGYYDRLRRPPSARAARRAELAAHVADAHAASRGTYGSPRVHAELRARGVACCENTVARVMRDRGIRGRV